MVALGAMHSHGPCREPRNSSRSEGRRVRLFLEVHVAHEVLRVFDDKPPTMEEKLRLLIHYAENDAYPEWVYTR